MYVCMYVCMYATHAHNKYYSRGHSSCATGVGVAAQLFEQLLERGDFEGARVRRHHLLHHLHETPQMRDLIRRARGDLEPVTITREFETGNRYLRFLPIHRLTRHCGTADNSRLEWLVEDCSV
jgi:hypothetical protein